MGAGASLGNLPGEILLDGQIPTNMPPVVISKDVLQGLRRKSFNEARRKSGARRASKQLMPVYEIPTTVTNLLDKIGISDSDGDTVSGKIGNRSPRGTVLPPQNKTTKLVAHIFECLGALQHLVRADQGQAVFNSCPDETEVAMERRSASLGQLVHEMVTIYGLCGDTMRVILDNNPEAAGMEDRFGRLPLHAAVDSKKPWIGSIMHMVDAYPDALSLKDGAGRLPLHIAVDQETPNIGLIKLLVDSNSAAAGITRGVGRLPIHYAVFPEVISYEMVDCLLKAFPAGCRAADVYGRLPLHYAVDKPTETNVAVIGRLLEEYPEGANKRDSHNKTPLMIALDRSGRNKASIRAVELLTKYSTIIDETNDPSLLPGKVAGPQSLLSIAMEVAQPNLDCIQFLAREFPEAILKPSGPGSDNVEHRSSVDLAKFPDLCRFLTIPDYFVRKNQHESSGAKLPDCDDFRVDAAVSFSPAYMTSSPLYTSLTKGWDDVARVLLKNCRPSAVVLLADGGIMSMLTKTESNAEPKAERDGDIVNAAALLRELNWRARRPGLLISINGHEEMGVGVGVDPLQGVPAVQIGSNGDSEAKQDWQDPLSDQFKSGGSPRANLSMIPENAKPMSAGSVVSNSGPGSPAQARLSGVNLLLLTRDKSDDVASVDMSVDEFDDDDSVDDGSIDLSVNSFRPRGVPFGRSRRKCNLFRKLYVAEQESWRHVLSFL